MAIRDLTNVEVARGLDEGRFELWFQPQWQVQTGRILAVEGLLRLFSPRLGLLGPETFVRTAETGGLIGRLTDTAIDQAAMWASTWRAADWHPAIAVNVSKAGLDDYTFPDRAEALCRRHGIRASQLTLEVTETVLTTDRSALHGVMALLRLKGFRLSLDDFGTGYASIDDLRSLPFQEVKLAKELLHAASFDSGSRETLESTVQQALALGIDTVAEGVETEELLRLAMSLGCHVCQGFLLTQPMPGNKVLSWVTDQRVQAIERMLASLRGSM